MMISSCWVSESRHMSIKQAHCFTPRPLFVSMAPRTLSAPRALSCLQGQSLRANDDFYDLLIKPYLWYRTLWWQCYDLSDQEDYVIMLSLARELLQLHRVQEYHGCETSWTKAFLAVLNWASHYLIWYNCCLVRSLRFGLVHIFGLLVHCILGDDDIGTPDCQNDDIRPNFGSKLRALRWLKPAIGGGKSTPPPARKIFHP